MGAGADGILLAVNLIKHAADVEPLEINLIEKNEKFGRGVAYSTECDFHLLNVPAGKMGAFPDGVEHFYQWLKNKNYVVEPNDFVSRRIYGEYLQNVFAETAAQKSESVKINLIKNEAVDVFFENDSATVLLDSGETVLSDKIVLAFGNFLPPPVRTKNRDYLKAQKYFPNPWDWGIFEKIGKNENVLVIGTGLTGIDVILSFYHREHAGKIFTVSNHGLLPAVHKAAEPYPAFSAELAGENKVLNLQKTIRKHIEKAESSGGDWRAVIDSLRPVTQEIWLRLSLAEKRKFMRHLRRRWDVARHRMPPICARILGEMRDAGKLEIRRGKIVEINFNENKFEVVHGAGNRLEVDAVINCTGSECNFERVDIPLVKNLVGKGFVKPDGLFLGLEATPEGKIVDKNGAISEKLFTFSTALRGILWETTAMPEIRAQAKNLAIQLLDNRNSKI